jgi:membrane associated rhomboid family serine protease
MKKHVSLVSIITALTLLFSIPPLVISFFNPELSTKLFDLLAVSGTSFQQGYYWTVFTYALMHGSILHLLLNGLMLVFLLQWAGSALGVARTVAICLVSTFVCGLYWALIPYHTTMVGASGYIMTLFTLWALFNPNKLVAFLFIIPMRAITGLWIFTALTAVCYYTGFGEFIAHDAHLIGTLVGLVYFLVIQKEYRAFRTSAPELESTKRTNLINLLIVDKSVISTGLQEKSFPSKESSHVYIIETPHQSIFHRCLNFTLLNSRQSLGLFILAFTLILSELSWGLVSSLSILSNQGWASNTIFSTYALVITLILLFTRYQVISFLLFAASFSYRLLPQDASLLQFWLVHAIYLLPCFTFLYLQLRRLHKVKMFTEICTSNPIPVNLKESKPFVSFLHKEFPGLEVEVSEINCTKAQTIT